MDRVGGYEGYQALLQDASAFDDVVTALQGEGDAERIRAAERRRASAKRGRR